MSRRRPARSGALALVRSIGPFPRVVATAIALAASLVTGAEPLVGQQSAPLRLTLEDALRMAEDGNPTYRRAANDADLNAVEMRTTWLDQILPTASVQLFTNFRGNLQRQARDNFGNPIANPSADWVYFSNTTQNLNLAWQLQGPSLFQAHRRQALVNQGRDLAERKALTDVQVQVRLLYMDALEQRELMESEAELLEARRVDQDVAERLFSLALRTRVDVLNAELAVEQQALVLRQQEAAFDRALLELKSALGSDDARPLELADEALPIFDPSGVDADALVAEALDVNPRLREADLAVETASLGVAEGRSAWWPQLNMGIDVYRRAQTTEGGALFDPALDQSLESQFFLQFSIPIVNDFFGSRERTQQATVALRNEREADRALRLDVAKTVRGAVLSLSNQWETLRLAQRSSEIAEEALRLAREQYRVGTLGFEQLRSSFDQEATTRRQVITARHAFVEALLRLEEAVGGPVRRAPAAGLGTGSPTVPAAPSASDGGR